MVIIAQQEYKGVSFRCSLALCGHANRHIIGPILDDRLEERILKP